MPTPENDVNRFAARLGTAILIEYPEFSQSDAIMSVVGEMIRSSGSPLSFVELIESVSQNLGLQDFMGIDLKAPVGFVLGYEISKPGSVRAIYKDVYSIKG